jgi:membrane-associated phospholipid phosphatase
LKRDSLLSTVRCSIYIFSWYFWQTHIEFLFYLYLNVLPPELVVNKHLTALRVLHFLASPFFFQFRLTQHFKVCDDCILTFRTPMALILFKNVRRPACVSVIRRSGDRD